MLQMQYEEAVYYLKLSSQRFLVLTVSGVSGLNNLIIALLQEMSKYQLMKYFQYDREEMFP